FEQQQEEEQAEGGCEPDHGEAPVEVAEDSTDIRISSGQEWSDLLRVASDVKSRMAHEPQQVQLESNRQDDQRDRSPEGESEGVTEERRNGLIPIPAGLDQAREEVARPGHQEGDDRARHEVGERDCGNRALDECVPLQTDGPRSPGIPDGNDTARWPFGRLRAWRDRAI